MPTHAHPHHHHSPPPTLPPQVVKFLITEEVRGRQRSVYGMRLKVNRINRQRADELGFNLRKAALAPAKAAEGGVASGAAGAAAAAQPPLR